MAFDYDLETVAVDHDALTNAKLKPDSILDAFAKAAKMVPGVARVDRIATLRKANFAKDPDRAAGGRIRSQRPPRSSWC